MDMLLFFNWINNDLFALPTSILFLGVGIVLTLQTRFIQIRAFPLFISLLTNGLARRKNKGEGSMKTMDSFHALSTAMATTIGIGNVVGPSIAVMTGGPGALIWLLVYIFFGMVTKFSEVCFALSTRTKTASGDIIGGPTRYLSLIHPFLAHWYGIIIIVLFVGWSALQANILADILVLEQVPKWQTGFALALLVFMALRGGMQRVGTILSKLVPVMFIFYIAFAFLILARDLHALNNALVLIFKSAFSSSAAFGGFLGATALRAMHAGIYKAIYITEAGAGTSSIPHSMADAKRPVDQGVLAMFSMIADGLLCLISGLLVVVTGVWSYGEFRSTLMYEVFKLYSSSFGQFVLIGSIALFVITTVIGNSFNGTQSFASMTNHRWVNGYIAVICCAIFFGSLVHVELAWAVTDTFLTLVAVPNVIGVLILAFRKPEVLKM